MNSSSVCLSPLEKNLFLKKTRYSSVVRQEYQWLFVSNKRPSACGWQVLGCPVF